MYSFMHVSRQVMLTQGQTLNLRKGLSLSGSNLLSVVAPIMERGFEKHLNALFAEGLSSHGQNYLYLLRSHDASAFEYAAWALETRFEYERVKSYPEMPSRLQSAFAWQDLDDARRFARGAIYAVEPLDKVAYCDMNLLTDAATPFGGLDENVKAYWAGGKTDDASYKPRIEVVMKCPVRVIERVG